MAIPQLSPITHLSLKWNMIEEESLSILEKFELIKELGFDGVELDAPNDLPQEEVLAARDRTGLKIPGVINSQHWKLPLTDPDPSVRRACRDSVVQAMDDTRRYGGDTVLVVPGVVDEKTSYKEAYGRAKKELEQLLPHAEATGVSIAVENVWNGFLLSPLEAIDFIDSFGSKHIGWYFDVGNVLRYGRPIHWIEALGDRILKVDLKEFSIRKMNEEGLWKGFDVPFGAGDCNWPAVLEALTKVGYSGWASVEVPGGDRQRLAAIKSEVDQVLVG